MDKIKKVRIGLISLGIFVQVLGFYLNIFTETRNVTYPIGITLPELFFPYTLEGSILMVVGTLIYWFGYRYSKEIKGKKELLKKILF
jgi:hypothetical protein